MASEDLHLSMGRGDLPAVLVASLGGFAEECTSATALVDLDAGFILLLVPLLLLLLLLGNKDECKMESFALAHTGFPLFCLQLVDSAFMENDWRTEAAEALEPLLL